MDRFDESLSGDKINIPCARRTNTLAMLSSPYHSAANTLPIGRGAFSCGGLSSCQLAMDS